MKKDERENGNGESPIKRFIATALFTTLLISLFFAVSRFIAAPEVLPAGAEYEKVKSDYLLMIIQCLAGIAVMALPSFMARKLKLVLPSVMCVVYYIFLYCAVFLGEIFSFYYRVPYWDSLLHATSSGMLGALGFILVDWLNNDDRVKLSMSPSFVSLFAFSFALSIGALWEIYEFSFDSFFGLNMQKYKFENGEMLVGRAALLDTMKDLIIDAISALAVALIGLSINLEKKRDQEKRPR